MLKEFIDKWKKVNDVNRLNRDLKKINDELKVINENYKDALTKSSKEVSRLANLNRAIINDRDATIANQKADYLMIDNLLKTLEEINRSGLKDKSKEQNQLINKIRTIIKKELDNASDID
jgi:hypothetical protein